MSQITEKVFLGNIQDAQNIEFITKNKITLIISVLGENLRQFHKDVKQVMFPIHDMPHENIIPIAEKCYDLILKNKGHVLVHCMQGVSRSSSVVIYYIMKRFKMNYDDTRAYVKEYRSMIWPNDGFEEQLMSIEHNFSNKKSKPKDQLVNPHLKNLGYTRF
jgi:predicted protein tyrosine phosphatase